MIHVGNCVIHLLLHMLYCVDCRLFSSLLCASWWAHIHIGKCNLQILLHVWLLCHLNKSLSGNTVYLIFRQIFNKVAAWNDVQSSDKEMVLGQWHQHKLCNSCCEVLMKSGMKCNENDGDSTGEVHEGCVMHLKVCNNLKMLKHSCKPRKNLKEIHFWTI